jgi:hypothetical protein
MRRKGASVGDAVVEVPAAVPIRGSAAGVTALTGVADPAGMGGMGGPSVGVVAAGAASAVADSVSAAGAVDSGDAVLRELATRLVQPPSQ